MAMAPSIRRLSKLLEGGEQDALQLDGQRQQAVEEGGDRRQFVLDAVRVHQLQAGGASNRSSEQPSTLPRTISR
jgi:hypothetical protein